MYTKVSEHKDWVEDLEELTKNTTEEFEEQMTSFVTKQSLL